VQFLEARGLLTSEEHWVKIVVVEEAGSSIPGAAKPAREPTSGEDF
jgi:hypothetical protein